jgi:hypothetical protein
MKKILIGVLLLALAAAVFADDALVLPKGVLRVYLTGAYAFFNQAFDVDGEKADPAGYDALNAINLGGAIEFGVLDWISAAVQWAPGWTIWSATDNGTIVAPGIDYANLTANGPYNIFAGAKVQIIGPDAPVKNERIRLAAATGVKIPVNAADPDYWSDQITAATTGEEWAGVYPDKPLWGLGARGYFDVVLNDMFYVNLYSEFIYYIGTVKREALGVSDWAAVNLLFQPNSDVSVGYDLTVEAEPHFQTTFGNGIRLGAGVPVTFSQSPELKYGDTAQADTDYYLLSISPNVSLFLTKFVLPIEFKLGYTLPLVGKNANAMNTVVFQIKAYYAKR